VGKDKISAVGLTASRWVTMHGIALNVDCNLANYKNIIPCGINLADHGVCSMQQIYDVSSTLQSSSPLSSSSLINSRRIDINNVVEKWMQSFMDVFNMKIATAYNTTAINSSASYYSEAERELVTVLTEFPHICTASLEVI